MDKQYIDRHKAYMLIKHEAETHELPASKEAYERAARIMAQMHPVNIAIMEQKTGRWIPHKAPFPIQSVYSCSKCNSSVPGNIFVVGCDFEFCPYCGVKMEEVENDEQMGRPNKSEY